MLEPADRLAPDRASEPAGGPATVPPAAGLRELREAARGCRACPLAGPATRTVFGDGPDSARMVLVGEQPGDVEDRRGLPFVGPAGRLLDRALADAGIDRPTTYVTNAVKHFRYRPTERRRIHQTPGPEHLAACRPWLDAELEVLAPEVVVCLGAVAARSLLGPTFRVTRSRGRLMPFDGPSRYEDAGVRSGWILATAHPSAVLRMPEQDRTRAYQNLVRDLSVAAAALA